MSFRISLFTLMCLLFATVQVTAQDSRVERRAKNRANQNVDRKVDQAVDKAFNDIGSLFKKKKKKPNTDATATETEAAQDAEAESPAGLSGLFGGEPWEPVQNDTPVSLVMDMTTTKKNGKTQDMTLTMVFDEWETGMETQSEGATTRVIFDNKSGSMTTITEKDGEQQGFRMKRNKPDLADVDALDASKYSVTKTGNTRVINGYKTEEYIIETEDGVTNAWITEEIQIDFTGLMGTFAGQQKGKAKMPDLDLPMADGTGFPIESTTVTKNGKETVVVRYRDIKQGDAIDRSLLDVTGVKIMSVGF